MIEDCEHPAALAAALVPACGFSMKKASTAAHAASAVTVLVLTLARCEINVPVSCKPLIYMINHLPRWMSAVWETACIFICCCNCTPVAFSKYHNHFPHLLICVGTHYCSKFQFNAQLRNHYINIPQGKPPS